MAIREVSELNQKIYAQTEAWPDRPIEGKHPYVFLDGLWMKWGCGGGEVHNMSRLVAIGVDGEGIHEVLAEDLSFTDDRRDCKAADTVLCAQ